MAVLASQVVENLFCIEENREEEAEKYHQLTQLIKVIDTLAILIPGLSLSSASPLQHK